MEKNYLVVEMCLALYLMVNCSLNIFGVGLQVVIVLSGVVLFEIDCD